LVAGNETTTNALGNAMLMLVQDPALHDRLAAQPELARPFVEESLRLVSPLQGFYRVATADSELGGVRIPAGAVLFLRWGAGNRDEAVFECPERLDIERPNLSQHMVFGSGVHFCLGNLLARTELYSAFQQITRRWKSLRIVGGDGAVERIRAFFNQGVARLPLAFDRRSPSE